MRIAVVGSGGREHALCKSIAASPLCTQLFCLPGNPGIAEVAQCIPVDVLDIPGIVQFCTTNRIQFVVVGPEGPLVEGVVDALGAAGILAFGPSRAAARLEGSKAFTKRLCIEAGIPTATAATYTSVDDATRHARDSAYPLVIKADGLAAGKGVVVAPDFEVARATIASALVERTFGNAGELLVIEEFLEGVELSYFVLADGSRYLPLEAAHDYKRVGDNDTGPNTGGMGAVSPTPRLTRDVEDQIRSAIIEPALATMQRKGTPFVGVLYAGVMVTASGPKLIEFNVRFGDPEAQALLARLDCDLLQVLLACAKGELREDMLRWTRDSAVAVVVGAPGYPERPRTGARLEVPAPDGDADAWLLHAGTSRVDGELRISGGRVLNVCARGRDVGEARDRAYRLLSSVAWPGAIYRRDIGAN